MPAETANYISQLVKTKPTGGESISEGDDHLRVIKTAVTQSFPNVSSAVNSTPAELNAVGKTASDLVLLDATVTALVEGVANIDTNSHGNVASCYWNPTFGTPLAYSHNITGVIANPSDPNGMQTRVDFTPGTLDGDPHYAFNLTPVNGTGRPTIMTVVGVAVDHLAFLSWQLIDSDWTAIPGAQLSFSMMVNDMESGQ